MEKLTITIGIPTCYGGHSLLKTAQSIRASRGVSHIRFLIEADSVPVSKDIKRQLRAMSIELREHKTPGTQLQKIKKMLHRTTSDIFVCTQDDVLFHPDALATIVAKFQQDPHLTMIGTNIQVHPPATRSERITSVGSRMVEYIGKHWRSGDNYLMSNGRCLAFLTKKLKTFRMPEKLVNSDAFFYFENKRLSGKFTYLAEAIIYNKNPQKYREFVRQHQRFSYSAEELLPYFSTDILAEYHIPKWALLRAFVTEWFHHPISTPGYVALMLTAAFHPLSQEAKTPIWKVNTSTKQ